MKTQLAIVAALAGLFAAGSVNAMIIDNFEEIQDQIYIAGPAPMASLGNLQLASIASILGGSRQTDVTLYARNAAADVNVRVVAGALDINDSISASTKVVLTWGANGAGLGNLDLYAGGANGIFLAFPTAMDHALSLRFDITDGGTSSVASSEITFPAGAHDSDFIFAFSNFTNVAALSSADSIRMTVNSTKAGLDVNVDLIETRDAPPNSVPEQGSICLLGLGLIGMRAMRRNIKGQ